MNRLALVLLLCAAMLVACDDGGEVAEPPGGTAEVTDAAEDADPPPDPDPSPDPAEDAQPEPAPAEPTAPPALAADAEGLARQIAEAEQVIRDDGAGNGQIATAAHVQQAAARHLARSPELRDQVLPLVPEALRGPVAAHVEAATHLGALATPQEQLPAWRIVAPPPPEQLLAHYREAQEAFGVGWEYLAAIHLVETRMGRIHGTSSAGAQGPMQFMPGTWAAYGEGDINDPRDAILAAGRYLAANGAPATMDNALFRYNNSNAYVRAITAYAEQMRADPRTFRGYYHWQVYYRHVDGDRLLPVGYDGAT